MTPETPKPGPARPSIARWLLNYSFMVDDFQYGFGFIRNQEESSPGNIAPPPDRDENKPDGSAP